MINIYYTEEERNNYLNMWINKSSESVLPYTQSEYDFYVNLNLENQIYPDLQSEHYIDNGCLCKGCSSKRKQIFEKAKKGITIKEKINHTEIINKIIESKNKEIEKINENKIKMNGVLNINPKSSQKIQNNLMTSLIRF